MNFIYTLFLFLIATSALGQTVKGRVISADQKPISNITIKLDGTDKITLTDVHGKFKINNIASGKYILTASAIGFIQVKLNLEVSLDTANSIELVLDRITNQLTEVVIGRSKRQLQDEASAAAAKIPLSAMENPQVTHFVPNQLIREQGATDLNSIMKNLPGVVKGWASTTTYYSSRGFNTRNYIRNGVSGYVTADPDIANVEQVIAIKGPSGTLFGSSLVSFGGVLNRVTKKPSVDPHTEIIFPTGSYDLNRVSADLNMPLSRNKNILLRINTAYHKEGSFQDAGINRGPFLAASFLYHLNKRLSISIDGEFFSREQTSSPQISPSGPIQSGSTKLWANNPDQLPLEYLRSYGNNSVTLKSTNKSIYGQITYKLSSSWTSQTNLNRTISGNSGNYLTFNLLKGDSLLVRNVSNYPGGTNNVTLLQQNLNGDFMLGNMRNRLVMGLEFFQNGSTSSSNALNGRNGRQSFDTLRVQQFMPDYPLISPEEISRKLNGLIPNNSSSHFSTYAFYASDVLDFSRSLSMMLSIRVDRFHQAGTTDLITNITKGNYSQTSLAPKIGIVYKILRDRIMLFSNYNNGFQNVAPATQPDGTIESFKPQYANQLEGGIKIELNPKLLNATINYYHIKVSNILRPDVNRADYTVQDGTQDSRGVELDITSQPIIGMRLTGGFAYNSSYLTSAQANVNGLRPVNSGPVRAVNLYVSYQLPFEFSHGIGLGIGGNCYGKSLIINNTTSGQFFLNPYTLLNAGIFFNSLKYRMAFNVDNFTNAKYYNGGFGSITPGMLRRFVTSISVKF